MKGTVKWFNQSSGYGFILSEEGQDHFVHVSNLVGKIQDGDDVEFDPEIGEKGPIALNVKSLQTQGEVEINADNVQSGNITRSSRTIFAAELALDNARDATDLAKVAPAFLLIFRCRPGFHSTLS